jgi:hypothetical protein
MLMVDGGLAAQKFAVPRQQSRVWTMHLGSAFQGSNVGIYMMGCRFSGRDSQTSMCSCKSLASKATHITSFLLGHDMYSIRSASIAHS